MQSLLRMEHDFEKEEFKRQTEVIGIRQKIQKGLCWFPVRLGRHFINSLNQYLLEISKPQDEDDEHNFEYGRTVCFFQLSANDTISYFHFTSKINLAHSNQMLVVMPDAGTIASLQQADRLGVQLYFDETSYQAMFQSVTEVMNAKGNRLALLRDILLGTTKSGFRDVFPVRFPWLNPAQEQAVNHVLRAKEVAIVHGPPGTGKTTTLVEAIYETLRRETQVLVCAQSNMAVDWISEKLVDRGLNVLRIGNPSRVNDKMLSFTYERRFENHPSYPELWSIRRQIRQLGAKRDKKGNGHPANIADKIAGLKDRATILEIQINSDLFDSALVVACTLVSSNSKMLDGHRFSTLFIDEAAQSLEAACWIAIRKADRVIFAGDHFQLPPTVKCPEAQKRGLGVTLMEYVSENKPELLTLLKIQYRMNEEIMSVSSKWFYHNEISAAPQVRYRSILDWENALEWIDTADMGFEEKFISETNGRLNVDEAELVLNYLVDYIGKIGMERTIEEKIDFGIISPYKSQVRYLRNKIKSKALYHAIKSQISIDTVDGFQGQEKDVILISLVRSNREGHIGFLQDLRRMNVAITRARMKLVIFGDTSTLRQHPFYRQLIESIVSESK